MPGTATSEAEVTNISQHGFWLPLDDRELFAPFEQFLWFKQAPVKAILKSNDRAPATSTGPSSTLTSPWTRSSIRSATR